MDIVIIAAAGITLVSLGGALALSTKYKGAMQVFNEAIDLIDMILDAAKDEKITQDEFDNIMAFVEEKLKYFRQIRDKTDRNR